MVSIITVCFNSESTIKDTINSVLNQTYPNIEYILIDGDSNDKTLSIIKSYEQKFNDKKIRYKWISEPDIGIYDAMNKGISIADGEIIGILNSDDWYDNDAVLEVVKTFENKTFSIVSGERRKVKFNKMPYGIHFNKKDIKKFIHKEMPVNHPATFVHKTVYKKIGLFDIHYKLSADYDFIYRAYKADVAFLFTDKILVNMRNSGATYQLKNTFITAKEDYQIRKKNKVKWAYFYYLKRIGFNYLLILRSVYRGIFKDNRN